MNTTTANGGKVTGLNISRKYALQMAARSRDGDTCDVVVSFISERWNRYRRQHLRQDSP